MTGKSIRKIAVRKFMPALMLAVLVLAFSAAPAPAAVLYNSFDAGDTFSADSGLGFGCFYMFLSCMFRTERAMSFTLPAGTDYYLDSIEVPVVFLQSHDAIPAKTFNIMIATDNAGQPGNVLEIQAAVAPDAAAKVTVNFGGTTVLTGGSTYWVWLSGPPDHTDLFNWRNTTAALTGDMAQSLDFGQTWTVTPNTTYAAFRVNGTATPPALPATVDMANAAEDLLIYGGTAGDGLPAGEPSVAVGDVNRDGVVDVIVGAPAAQGGKGEVYVFFGDAPLAGTRDVAGTSGTIPGMTITGAEAGDALGSAVAVADITGDGIGDLVLGAPGADGPANGRAGAGEVYLIAGAASLPVTLTIVSGTGFVPVYGATAGDAVGGAILLGDITGDGRADVVLGSPDADGAGDLLAGAGEAYVINGAATLPTSVDLDTTQPGTHQNVTVYGGGAGENLTIDRAMILGDMNEDGVRDLILGTKNAGNGEAYIIYGSGAMSATYDIGTGAEDVTILGATAGDALTSGGAMAVGDVNGDGTDDLVLGAPGADASGDAKAGAGEAYVIYGSAALGATIDFSTSGEDLTIYGADAGDALTKEGALKVGDVTGDGIDDIVLGAMDAASAGNARANAGEAYLVKGNAGFGATLDLAASADTIFYGADGGDALTAGGGIMLADVNGDGNADVVLGGPGADGPSNLRADAGEAYVVYGSNALAASIDFNGSGEDVTIYGATAGDAMTASGAMAFGDVNENGADDLIFGAALADGPAEGRAAAGEVYVVCEGVLPASDTVKRTSHSGNPAPKSFGTTGVTMDFSSGTNDSTTTVVLTRSDAGVNMILARTANMQWQITSDRAAFATSITFHYQDSQVAGLNEKYLDIYASPTLGGTYTLLTTTHNRFLNTATVTGVTGFSFFVLYESDPDPVCFIGSVADEGSAGRMVLEAASSLARKVKEYVAKL
ncbi:MAG: FG-GAP repeat protein [Deltaproteobacteria bacterium]|nr:FG-GAP repeat protein [Deltaproteobacteria bacterium]